MTRRRGKKYNILNGVIKMNDQNTMKDKNISKSERKGPSLTNVVLGLASLGAGAYHGYCDAQGIAFEKENLEFGLTYGPAIVRGSLGALKGLIGGSIVGGIGGGLVGAFIREKVSDAVYGAGTGTAVGGLTGAALGGPFGAIKAGIHTLMGYGLGYFAGYVNK